MMEENNWKLEDFAAEETKDVKTIDTEYLGWVFGVVF